MDKDALLALRGAVRGQNPQWRATRRRRVRAVRHQILVPQAASSSAFVIDARGSRARRPAQQGTRRLPPRRASPRARYGAPYMCMSRGTSRRYVPWGTPIVGAVDRLQRAVAASSGCVAERVCARNSVAARAARRKLHQPSAVVERRAPAGHLCAENDLW